LCVGGVTPFFNTGGQYDPVGNSWIPTSTVGAPAGRHSHTAVWTGSRMIVWGGHIFQLPYTPSGGQFDPINGAWGTAGTTTIGGPTGRGMHTAVWRGTQMIVWGGDAGTIRTNTGARYTALSVYRKN
jgi:hypothetical protein